MSIGVFPIEEPSLQEIIKSSVAVGKIKASTKPDYANIFVIAVPTPIKEDPNLPKPNLEFVEDAIESIVPF